MRRPATVLVQFEEPQTPELEVHFSPMDSESTFKCSSHGVSIAPLRNTGWPLPHPLQVVYNIAIRLTRAYTRNSEHLGVVQSLPASSCLPQWPLLTHRIPLSL